MVSKSLIKLGVIVAVVLALVTSATGISVADELGVCGSTSDVVDIFEDHDIKNESLEGNMTKEEFIESPLVKQGEEKKYISITRNDALDFVCWAENKGIWDR